MKEISINTPFIKLDQFIKFIGLTASGSEAKWLIQNGEVQVNGEICLMRGKKLKEGDEVFISDIGTFKIVDEN
ncbi:MAG: RNA-binding S4 domain-containing protein [Eubacteriaceae bacterium]|jgi:ribosome-associated protein|nr:RNA-binding S4 domain-containing protein [Eubacteriaceae bacterium]